MLKIDEDERNLGGVPLFFIPIMIPNSFVKSRVCLRVSIITTRIFFGCMNAWRPHKRNENHRLD